MQTCQESLWHRYAYSSFYGSFFGEDVRKDAWNGVLEILRQRWLRFQEADPSAAGRLRGGHGQRPWAAAVDSAPADTAPDMLPPREAPPPLLDAAAEVWSTGRAVGGGPQAGATESLEYMEPVPEDLWREVENLEDVELE